MVMNPGCGKIIHIHVFSIMQISDRFGSMLPSLPNRPVAGIPATGVVDNSGPVNQSEPISASLSARL